MPRLGIADAVSQGRVKLHVFSPSGRTVWTVVGREDEYWTDPDSRYCSCPGYHFGMSRSCYHIKWLERAQKLSMYETAEFDDAEFDGFMSGLVDDST